MDEWRRPDRWLAPLHSSRNAVPTMVHDEIQEPRNPAMVRNMTVHDFLLVACSLGILFYALKRGSTDAITEAINNLVNNLRGGPPSPMHPMPADDKVILLRRRSGKS
jgi:hypothetical protein